jgi:hypothetical protein
MKRIDLIRHLEKNGCDFLRHEWNRTLLDPWP